MWRGLTGRSATGVAAAAIVTSSVLGALFAASVETRAVQSSRESRDTVEPTTYFVATGAASSGYRPSDAELAVWALASWAKQSAGAIRVQAAPEPQALIRLSWAPPRGGVYGEMRPVTVNGREGAEVFVRADTDALDPDIAERAQRDPLWRDTVVYLTCLHELGHALGLSHTADMRDIMYFFGFGGDIVEFFARYRRRLTTRADIQSVSGLSDADVRRLRALHPAR